MIIYAKFQGTKGEQKAVLPNMGHRACNMRQNLWGELLPGGWEDQPPDTYVILPACCRYLIGKNRSFLDIVLHVNAASYGNTIA